MSTPYEGYRRKLAVRTAEGDAVTLIVTVQRGHRHGPVWLSFDSTTRTTVALSGAEVGELTGALHAAAGNDGDATPSEPAVDAAAAGADRGRHAASAAGGLRRRPRASAIR